MTSLPRPSGRARSNWVFRCRFILVGQSLLSVFASLIDPLSRQSAFWCAVQVWPDPANSRTLLFGDGDVILKIIEPLDGQHGISILLPSARFHYSA